MGLRAKVVNAVEWTALFACFLSGSIFLTINAIWLYRLNVSLQGLNKLFNLSVPVLMHNYHQMIAYLEFPWINHLRMTDFPDSARALFHFYQVKQLFLLNNAVLIISGIISYFLIRRLIKQREVWRLIIPMRSALYVPPLFAILMALNFQQFFITFHKLFFHNSDWLFDPNQDPIIMVLPDTFFLQCFVMVILLLEIVFAIALWQGKKALARSN